VSSSLSSKSWSIGIFSQSRLIGSVLDPSQRPLEICLRRLFQKRHFMPSASHRIAWAASTLNEVSAYTTSTSSPCHCIGDAIVDTNPILSADGELHIQNPSALWWTTTKISDHHTSLDQIFKSLPMLSTCGVWYEVDGSATIYQHLGHTCGDKIQAREGGQGIQGTVLIDIIYIYIHIYIYTYIYIYIYIYIYRTNFIYPRV